MIKKNGKILFFGDVSRAAGIPYILQRGKKEKNEFAIFYHLKSFPSILYLLVFVSLCLTTLFKFTNANKVNKRCAKYKKTLLPPNALFLLFVFLYGFDSFSMLNHPGGGGMGYSEHCCCVFICSWQPFGSFYRSFSSFFLCFHLPTHLKKNV